MPTKLHKKMEKHSFLMLQCFVLAKKQVFTVEKLLIITLFLIIFQPIVETLGIPAALAVDSTKLKTAGA